MTQREQGMIREFGFTALMCLISVLLATARISAGEKPAPMVGVYYFPGWYRAAGNPSGEYSEWRSAIMKAAVPRALCGFYDDSDPRLWDYYIRWMTTHGIDFVAFDWYYNLGQEYLYESLDRGFLQSARCSSLKFCIHWCNHGGSWFHKPLDQTKRAILDMTDRLCARYFHRPNYLRIHGRPVFMIYDIEQLLSFGGPAAARDALTAMRRRAREHGFDGVYLVAVYPSSSPEYLRMLKSIGFDASCAYTYAWMRPPTVLYHTRAAPYADIVEMLAEYTYPHLSRLGREAGLPYWPTTFSGWDDRPRAGLERAFVNLNSTPEAFSRMLIGALKNTNDSSPVVLVEAWNEWGEGACIEPSKEHGFGYLKAIAAALGKTAPDERLPSAEEIASWSVLTPEELKTAAENESKPWPLPEPAWARRGKSLEVPKIRMPYVLDFSSSGIPSDRLSLNNVTIRERTSEGIRFETTGGDPMIILPTVQVPMEQIRRITVEGEVEGGIPENVNDQRIEVFWATSLYPDFSQFASASIPWTSGGKSSVQIADIPWWKATGTPLTGLRIDPCSGPNVRFLLRRIVLSGE